MPADLCHAAASYDPGTNTITLGAGTNTLSSLCDDISNSSVISYNADSNTYTLNAHISGQNGVDADLVMENSTLRLNEDLLIKTFHDFTSKSNPIGDSNYMLSLELCAAENAYLYDNSFENVHLNSDGTSYEGIIKFNGYTGLVMDQVSFTNCTVPSIHNHYGIVYFYGTAGTTPCPVVSNVTINNCKGMGLCGKEYGNVVYRDIAVSNVTRQAIFFYHSLGYGNTRHWVSNATINGADVGISANANSDVTADIYNVKIKNVRLAYNTNYYGLNTFFITNSTESNYTTLYSVPNNKEGEIRRYELLDVCVTDDWGDPVSGATVTISVDNPDGADLCSINRLLDELTQTTTLSNGHTPLPCEDQAATIALLRFLKTDTFQQSGFS